PSRTRRPTGVVARCNSPATFASNRWPPVLRLTFQDPAARRNARPVATARAPRHRLARTRDARSSFIFERCHDRPGTPWSGGPQRCPIPGRDVGPGPARTVVDAFAYAHAFGAATCLETVPVQPILVDGSACRSDGEANR